MSTATQQPAAPPADVPRETVQPLWLRRLSQLAIESEADELLLSRLYKILDNLPFELCIDEHGRQLPDTECMRLRVASYQVVGKLRGVNDSRSELVNVIRNLPLPILRGFRKAAKSESLPVFLQGYA